MSRRCYTRGKVIGLYGKIALWYVWSFPTPLQVLSLAGAQLHAQLSYIKPSVLVLDFLREGSPNSMGERQEKNPGETCYQHSCLMIIPELEGRRVILSCLTRRP
jgi:hypothetical protein